MLLTNAHIATLEPRSGYGLIENGAILVEDGLIRWVGRAADFKDGVRDHQEHDLEGRLVTPALIDCHTHIIHGGHRAGEFALRLEGASYEEVARKGGGIVSTVRATREALCHASMRSFAKV